MYKDISSSSGAQAMDGISAHLGVHEPLSSSTMAWWDWAFAKVGVQLLYTVTIMPLHAQNEAGRGRSC